MSLWVGGSFVFVKIRNLEFGRDNYPRHEAHCSSTESRSLDTLHGFETLFKSIVHLCIFNNSINVIRVGIIKIYDVVMIINIILRNSVGVSTFTLLFPPFVEVKGAAVASLATL